MLTVNSFSKYDVVQIAEKRKVLFATNYGNVPDKDR
jgi:hypothetical protein